MSRVRHPHRPTLRYGQVNDPLVVPTALLSSYVREWVEEHNNSHGPSDVGGAEILAERAAVHPDTIRKLVTGRETTFTSHAMADIVLTAMNRNHLLNTGELPVLPNPRYSQRGWHARIRAAGVDEPEELLT